MTNRVYASPMRVFKRLSRRYHYELSVQFYTDILIPISFVYSQDVIYKPYLARKEEDNIRFNNVLSQYRNHRILLRKKWKVQKNYLIGPRRAWKDR